MLQGAARYCKGPVGLLRVTESCKRLWGAMKGPPWSLESEILQIFVFKLLIDTNNELKKNKK
jgi:hypothetical protein